MRMQPLLPLLARYRLAAAFALAACCALVVALPGPAGEDVRQPDHVGRLIAPDASARGRRPGLPGFEQMMGVGPAAASAAPVAPATATATTTPTETIPIHGRVSPELIAQGIAKAQIQDRLAAVQTAGGARPGEPVDRSQPSIADPLARGIIDLGPGTTAAFAYIEPYREPDNWAYRNYCGPGAAIALLSHWDRSYPSRADIDLLGRDMSLNPNMGVSILNMVDPINRRLNEITGQGVDWYRYGRAASLDDLRYMMRIDLAEHGVPLITGLMTGGLPGWGGSDVGHFVAIYGYTRTADGTEYVSYADTAAPVSNHHGPNLHAWELNSFWQAVSRNCGQIW